MIKWTSVEFIYKWHSKPKRNTRGYISWIVPKNVPQFCFYPPKDSNKREQILTCCRKGPPNESFQLVYSTRPTIGPLVSVSVLGVTEIHNQSWSPSLRRLWIYPNKSVFYLNGTWFCAISMGNYRYQALRYSDILYTTCIWYINIHTSYTYIYIYAYMYLYIYTMYIPCIVYDSIIKYITTPRF